MEKGVRGCKVPDNDRWAHIRDIIDVRCRSGLVTPPQLLSLLKNSAHDGRVAVLRSPTKAPIGYFAWASVTKEGLRHVIRSKQMPPFSYEWNEGRLMVVYDVVIAPGWQLIGRKALLKKLKKQRFVAFLKRQNLHVWQKHKGKHQRAML
jgi:hemolysin-activating ACP:hemolysin acyltransferase